MKELNEGEKIASIVRSCSSLKYLLYYVPIASFPPHTWLELSSALGPSLLLKVHSLSYCPLRQLALEYDPFLFRP